MNVLLTFGSNWRKETWTMNRPSRVLMIKGSCLGRHDWTIPGSCNEIIPVTGRGAKASGHLQERRMPNFHLDGGNGTFSIV